MVTALPLYSFASFDDPSIAHGVSTRAGGVSVGPYASLNLGASVGDHPDAVSENRARLARALGFTGEQMVTTPQVHGATVLVVDESNADRALEIRADALLTTRPGFLLMQRFADCVPLLFWHPTARAVAVAHAGWRGTALGVAGTTVAALREHAGAAPVGLRAAIGPAIGRCCYEVGADVAETVALATPDPPATLTEWQPDGKARIDITAANVAQLQATGLHPAHIIAADVCTACRTDLFYSHRREGEPTGRFGAAISLRGTSR